MEGYFQLNLSLAIADIIPAGICRFNELLATPASSNKTWFSGFAERRLARTQPADPPPTII